MGLLVLDKSGKRVLLMGNEAIARGALEAGVEVASAYPGTPSSEVLETLWEASKSSEFYAEWSTNEKVALEVAAGASVSGARALCAMKNAGLNVAMDTFTTLPYTGIRGGLVIVVADDPGAHYSSTEQDTRPLAAYAEIPCLEPCDQEEARDMTREAFALSEAVELPVMVRSVTRLSHASGDVVLREPVARKSAVGFNKHYLIPYRWNVYGAPGAVSKHKWLHGALAKAASVCDGSPFNSLHLADGARLGILASGLGYAYVRDILIEAGLLDRVNLLKIGTVNPVPDGLVRKLVSASEMVLVIEDGDPYLEKHVRAFDGAVDTLGKTGDEPLMNPWDELTPDVVRAAVRLAMKKAGYAAHQVKPLGAGGTEGAKDNARKLVVPRSSALCPGCPHLGSYWAIKQSLAARPGVHIVNGDIGCYEQGGYGLCGENIQANAGISRKYSIRTPYETLDTLYVMGSGLGMAQGQSHLSGLDGKILAVSGDSTFFHALLPTVANAALTRANITYLILDNRWTAMTGHQPSPRTGQNQVGDPTCTLDIEEIVKALGVKRVYRGSAFDIGGAKELLDRALSEDGPAVVILEGECALQIVRRKETKPALVVDEAKCIGCKTCVQLGCSAITFDAGRRVAGIEKASCTGCGLCTAVCPVDATDIPRAAATSDGMGGGKNAG